MPRLPSRRPIRTAVAYLTGGLEAVSTLPRAVLGKGEPFRPGLGGYETSPDLSGHSSVISHPEGAAGR